MGFANRPLINPGLITVTSVEAVTSPAGELARKIYVALVVSVTVAIPVGDTVPIPDMVTEFAPSTFHTSIALVPGCIVFGTDMNSRTPFPMY